MSIPVLYDACVLYGNEVRDLLIRIVPDPDDRHVLAAAIAAGAVVIVTSNLDDFPAETLQPFSIEAKTPDDFVLDQISLDEGRVRECVHQIARVATSFRR